MCICVYQSDCPVDFFQCLICPVKIGTNEYFAINSVLKNVFKKFNNVS